MQPEPVHISVELPRDLYCRLNEMAARCGCTAPQLILRSIESAVVAVLRQRSKKRLSLDGALVPPAGKAINPTDEQIYGGIEFP